METSHAKESNGDTSRWNRQRLLSFATFTKKKRDRTIPSIAYTTIVCASSPSNTTLLPLPIYSDMDLADRNHLRILFSHFQHNMCHNML